MIRLLEYKDKNGVVPFERWRESLDPIVKARVILAAYRLAEGNSSRRKGVGGIFELRLDFGPGYRVYFGKDGEELILLLGGGTKKRQQQDIEAAKLLWQEYKHSKLPKRETKS